MHGCSKNSYERNANDLCWWPTLWRSLNIEDLWIDCILFTRNSWDWVIMYRLAYYCRPYSSYSQYSKSICHAVKLSFNRSLNMRLTSLLDDVIKMTLSSHTRLSWFQILTFAFMSFVLHTNSCRAPQQRYKLSYFVLFVVSTNYNALRAAILLRSATHTVCYWICL